MFLQNLGADERVRHLISSHAQPGIELGRICFASHEQYRAFLESGEYDATPTGKMRWGDSLPAVGDWVAARPVDRSFVLIEDVLPRRTQFSRAAVGRALREQVIAANIDLSFIVCGLDHDFNLRRIERYLVLAQESRAEAIVVLNKMDLCADLERKLAQVRAVAPDLTVLSISARTSVNALLPFTHNKTVALLGSSGAGKSTIANALIGGRIQETGGVREHDSRGRHVTTGRMLIPLADGGALIDNPGMRELQLWASESSLDDVFTDVSSIAQKCRFADCTHTSEPRCALLAALESGQLDAARWKSYQKLDAELKHQHRQQDKHAMLAQKKQWKAIHKAMRHHPKYTK